MKTRFFSISFWALMSSAIYGQIPATMQGNQPVNVQYQVIAPQTQGPKMNLKAARQANAANGANQQQTTGASIETIPNDPFNARIYTLKNGLKVYISVNKDAPRIQTMIAVKAGSKFDPPQTTGLAHYLEHMMFKGSHDYGTQNWAQESILLDSISAYFEYHRNEKDEVKKALLYDKIDSF